jgi:hypothetical protein
MSKDSLHELYDRLFEIDADATNISKDFYTAISDATDATGEGHAAELDPKLLLYLFEYHKIIKIWATNSPYACMEWPGVRNP